MKKVLSIVVAFFMMSTFFAQVQKPSLASKALNDTIVFDIANSTYYANAGQYYIDIPVLLKSNTTNINSFDFWFQFNQAELTYVSTTSLITGLDAFSNFNQANFYLSNTSSGTSISFNIPVNIPVIKLTFELSSACDLINSQDFSNMTTLFDGIVSSYKFTSQVPSPIQVTSPLPTCTNNDISFTYESYYSGKPITNYTWDFGNGATAYNQTDSTHYATSGFYTINLEVTTQDGCTYTQSLPIEIMDGPLASFTSVQGASLGEVIFTNTSTFSSGVITQSNWNFGDGSTSSLMDPVHVFPGADNYDVSLTVMADNGCTNTITNSVSTIGLSDNELFDLVLYPNPSRNVLWVQGEWTFGGNYEIKNAFGQLVQFGTLTASKMIDVHSLSEGTYWLSINGYKPQQFVKYE